MEAVPPCTGMADGTCVHHEAEMTRREGDRVRISDVRDETCENRRLIGHLLTFQNFIKGASLLGMLVVIGGYTYTYTHEVSSNLRITTNTSDIKELRRIIGDLKTNLAVTNTSFIALQEKISTTNSRLEQLIDMMNEEHHDKR